MRVSSSDKTEIIRMVEPSHLPARRTLEFGFVTSTGPIPVWIGRTGSRP